MVLTVELKNAGMIEEDSPSRDIILNFIRHAETNHGFIGLTDYVSDSGHRANYVIQPYGPNAYNRLVQESLDQLRNDEIEKPSQVFGEDLDDETWKQAVAEQIASFEKTLGKGHQRKSSRVKVDKGFYAIDGIPYVFNIRLVSYHETPEQKAHNSSLGDAIEKVPKKLKSKAKAFIRNAVALSNYRGQFRLEAGKFKRIAFGKNSISFEIF